MPCVPAPAMTLVTVNAWPDSPAAPAVSLAVRSPAGKLSAVSSSVVLLSALATGGSLTSVTLMLTVATLESLSPSLALKVKLSEPL